MNAIQLLSIHIQVIQSFVISKSHFHTQKSKTKTETKNKEMKMGKKK